MSQVVGAHARFNRFVNWSITVERPQAPDFLAGEPLRAFEDYYAGLPNGSDRGELSRYQRAMWRAEAGWTARWLASFASRSGRPAAVLDAGCGFGTFAMLFGIVGGDVTGVDLRPDRLDAAVKRLAHCQATTGWALPVRYERADLTAEWSRDYDLVWLYNAISHIDPLDAFLEQLRRHLRPGGRVVVGDINGGHPAHLRRLAGLRTEVHQEYVTPEGERHPYAVERTFSPGELRREIRRHGLHVMHHALYWGGLGLLPHAVHAAVLEPLQAQWWLGARMARRQLLVAGRGGD